MVNYLSMNYAEIMAISGARGLTLREVSDLRMLGGGMASCHNGRKQRLETKKAVANRDGLLCLDL